MDRELLRRYLEGGLSLPQIGRLVGRHPSTVGYWVAKHGLVANGKRDYSPKGGLAHEQLEPLVLSGRPYASIARELGVSLSTVHYWTRKHGLAKPRKVPRAAIEAALRNGSRTVASRCRRHGETDFVIVGGGKGVRCRMCRAEAVARRRRKVKRILVDEAGGRCRICGYDRCIAALEFHHINPGEKSFGLAQRGITRAIEKVREEAAKCVLLCANCHVEVETGAAELPLQFQ
jgi:transposase-like protein